MKIDYYLDEDDFLTHQLFIASRSPRIQSKQSSYVDMKNPPKSVRSLYNDRYQMELQTSAGRALREHIGGGHIVLMDSTPRAQRCYFIISKKLFNADIHINYGILC